MANITILQNPATNAGTMITPSAGSNRLVLYTYCYYDPTLVTTPTSVTCNGVSGTFSFGDAPGSTPARCSCSTWYFKESDIATISGQAITSAGSTGTLDGRIVTVLQDCPQTSMVFDSDVGHASSGTITKALDRDNNSLSIMFSLCQNSGGTLTLGEPAYVGRFGFGFTSVSYGYAADTFRTANATTVVGANGNTGMTVANFKSIGATIVSINGGSPVEVGSSITVTTTGFTGTPAATFNVSGVSASVSGSANSWTLVFGNRVNGSLFPLLPATVDLTLTNGSEVATLAMPSFTKKSTETEVVFSGAVTGSPTQYVSSAIYADGFTVEGAENHYIPVGDLVLYPDGSWTTTNSLPFTFSMWFRPITGTGSGNAYSYDFTIGAGGITSSTGLTRAGLTTAGLTRTGLTTAGL